MYAPHLQADVHLPPTHPLKAHCQVAHLYANRRIVLALPYSHTVGQCKELLLLHSLQRQRALLLFDENGVS
jgi:hypothetical protein